VTYWDKSPDRHAVCATTSLIGVTGSASAALTLVNLDPGDLEAVTTAAVDTELNTEVGEWRLGTLGFVVRQKAWQVCWVTGVEAECTKLPPVIGWKSRDPVPSVLASAWLQPRYSLGSYKVLKV
jgi:hypothetical protein